MDSMRSSEKTAGQDAKRKPRSGEITQPTAQAVGRQQINEAPKGRKKGLNTNPGQRPDICSTRPDRGTYSSKPQEGRRESDPLARRVAPNQANRECRLLDKSGPSPPAAATDAGSARHRTSPGLYSPPQSDVICRRTGGSH